MSVRFWDRVDRSGGPDACWPWTGHIDKRSGYGWFWWKGKNRRAHRVAWELTHGSPPTKNTLHTCDNRRCQNPKHLFDDSQAANMADMVAKGRQTKGEAVNTNKLTPDQVREIRRRSESGESSSALAIAFGVNRQMIWKIKARRDWRHIE